MDRADAELALETNAGTSAPDAANIVTALIAAVTEELIETMAGASASPSTVADIRAHRLQLFYKHFTARPLTRLEIQTIFRVQPNQAVAIDRKMRASFPTTANSLLRRLVVAAAGDTVREGDVEAGFRWVVPFAQMSGLEAAETLLERKGLHAIPNWRRAQRRMEIPLTDADLARRILVDELGLTEP